MSLGRSKVTSAAPLQDDGRRASARSCQRLCVSKMYSKFSLCLCARLYLHSLHSPLFLDAVHYKASSRHLRSNFPMYPWHYDTHLSCDSYSLWYRYITISHANQLRRNNLFATVWRFNIQSLSRLSPLLITNVVSSFCLSVHIFDLFAFDKCLLF